MMGQGGSEVRRAEFDAEATFMYARLRMPIEFRLLTRGSGQQTLPSSRTRPSLRGRRPNSRHRRPLFGRVPDSIEVEAQRTGET